jgi:hypothetical protein
LFCTVSRNQKITTKSKKRKAKIKNFIVGSTGQSRSGFFLKSFWKLPDPVTGPRAFTGKILSFFCEPVPGREHVFVAAPACRAGMAAPAAALRGAVCFAGDVSLPLHKVEPVFELFLREPDARRKFRNGKIPITDPLCN